MVESEHVRWVRYAVDCVKRALPLLGTCDKPEVEAAISAARVWADEPTEDNLKIALTSVQNYMDSSYAAYSGIVEIYEAAANAVFATKNADIASMSAANAAKKVVAAIGWKAGDACRAIPINWFGVDSEATTEERRKTMDIWKKAEAAEREWQAERRRYYGLPEEE